MPKRDRQLQAATESRSPRTATRTVTSVPSTAMYLAFDLVPIPHPVSPNALAGMAGGLSLVPFVATSTKSHAPLLFPLLASSPFLPTLLERNDSFLGISFVALGLVVSDVILRLTMDDLFRRNAHDAIMSISCDASRV